MKKHLLCLSAFLLFSGFLFAQSAQQASSSKPAVQLQTNTVADAGNAPAVPGSGAPSAMAAAPHLESMHRKAVDKAPVAANQPVAGKGNHAAKPLALKPVNANSDNK